MKTTREYQGEPPHGDYVIDIEVEEEDYCIGCGKICREYSDVFSKAEEGYCQCDDYCCNCRLATRRWKAEIEQGER